jgi:VCBS repeat-containing protein
VEKLIQTGYLAQSERHKTTAVVRAWDRAKQDIEKRIAGRNDPDLAR